MAEPNKNPFEQLNTNLREVPAELRKKVMADVALAKLILEMASFFTSNYAALISGLFKTNRRNKTT